MRHLGRMSLSPFKSPAHEFNIKTFHRAHEFRFSKEISMCSRRNIRWTTASIATKVGVLTAERTAVPLHTRPQTREKASNHDEGLFPRRRCDRSCKSFAGARGLCARADERPSADQGHDSPPSARTAAAGQGIAGRSACSGCACHCCHLSFRDCSDLGLDFAHEYLCDSVSGYGQKNRGS